MLLAAVAGISLIIGGIGTLASPVRLSAGANAAAWQAALQENEQGKKSKAIALDRLEADLAESCVVGGNQRALACASR